MVACACTACSHGAQPGRLPLRATDLLCALHWLHWLITHIRGQTVPSTVVKTQACRWLLAL